VAAKSLRGQSTPANLETFAGQYTNPAEAAIGYSFY